MLKRALFITAFALFGVALSTAPAFALPTFAKAYGVQCSVCHTIPPQLNAYGRYVQRTGYSALSRDLLKSTVPLTLTEQPQTDTSNGSGAIQFGNTAIHVAGYLSPDITYHIHQWLLQDGQGGGIDTFQFVYNNLFKETTHFFVGKLSALPVPGPFSNQTDLAPYASAELQVGEHMYQLDMMRWGTAVSYVRPKFFAEASWFGSNGDWASAFDFSSNTDKTFEWVAAYADAGKPWELGTYGQIGSWPLTEGGVDHYNTFALYAQRDPGPNFMPGLLTLYQCGYDANPGTVTMDSGMPGAATFAQLPQLSALLQLVPRLYAPRLNAPRSFAPVSSSMPMPSPTPMAPHITPASSQAVSLEAWEPVINNRAILALRYEYTNDGLGTLAHTGNVDFDVRPFNHYNYLHLYLESALQQSAGPAWRTMLWWSVPIGIWDSER